MIPLSLVTGFLGSGKTTLLQQMVGCRRGRRVAYVVNECGAVNVDGQLLSLPPEQVVEIVGGSIFCRCLAGEFIRWLQAIPGHCVAPGECLDGVVVEASGIADPKVVEQMLQETGLDRLYELRMIVSVVDPGSFLKLIHTLPNVIAQVEACDLAIVNKTDLYGENHIRHVEEEIARLNPAARVVRSQYCRVEVDIFAASARRPLNGQYAPCADPHYATSAVTLPRPIDAERLLAELRGIQEEVYRVKGFVPVTDGWLYVDVSSSGLTTRQVPDSGQAGNLVFVVRPQAQQRTKELIARLKHGELDAASSSDRRRSQAGVDVGFTR